MPQPLPAHRRDARGRAVRLAGQPDRHAGARAAQPPGDRGRQARLEREADRQLARRRAGAAATRGRRSGVRLWGAPITVAEPAVRVHGEDARRRASSAASPRPTPTTATTARTGRRSSTRRAAAACPTSRVYNLTTLTGLLGPAKPVTAMISIVTPDAADRRARARSRSTEEDNAMVLMDHGNGVISHVQSGFNYFNPHGHDGSKETRHTITIVGSHGLHGPGRLRLGAAWAWIWRPRSSRSSSAHATDAKGYVWQQGASLAAEMPGDRRGAARHAGARAARAGDHHGRPRVAGDRPAGGLDLHVPVASRQLTPKGEARSPVRCSAAHPASTRIEVVVGVEGQA